MVHALGGGAGSGAGSLLLQRLADEYHDRIIVSYPVFPSPLTSDVVTEPYNAVMRQLDSVLWIVCSGKRVPDCDFRMASSR